MRLSHNSHSDPFIAWRSLNPKKSLFTGAARVVQSRKQTRKHTKHIETNGMSEAKNAKIIKESVNVNQLSHLPFKI